MENVTAAEMWTAILAVASAIVLLYNAGKALAGIRQAAKAPNDKLTQRIDDLEARVGKVEKNQEKDREHFDAIDASNRVTQVALLALLDHGIDGNNIDQMQHAKEELQTHLINR